MVHAIQEEVGRRLVSIISIIELEGCIFAADHAICDAVADVEGLRGELIGAVGGLELSS